MIRKIIASYHIDEMIGRIVGKDAGLFLDLAAYSILTENNAGQYYPDYAYKHPLFTKGMHVYSDSKVSDFIGQDMTGARIAFLNEWNKSRNHRSKIYVSYDSTNKHCQAGDIDLAKIGHEKDKQDKPIFNCTVAYDRNNNEPLFYEGYPGSINDVSQLQYMLEKVEGYGYKNIGFILDRGYFSEANIHYMDHHGYGFVIMVKGMKDLVSALVLKHKGSFEQSRANSIKSYKVNGVIVKMQLFPSDEKDRYFHIYYNDRKHAAERENVERKIDRIVEFLEKNRGKKIPKSPNIEKYFKLEIYNEGKEDERLLAWRERTDVIDREIALCGYFVLITSESMTAEEAKESGRKENYMTVPAALKELEKIEMIKSSDNTYRIDHAVSATQKAILKAFGMNATFSLAFFGSSLVVFKYYFHYGMKEFFLDHLKYLLITVAIGTVVYTICGAVVLQSIVITLLIKSIMCFSLTFLLYWLILRKFSNYNETITWLKKVLKAKC
ncbi:transposase [Butyrivibrio proteoclasticus]|uniref:IS1634 family transposase n=1 Tax=Butyrivibrio proteoclasticus TaxID=43305 RepID=UPI0011602393|nr:transposase [Butyrivibrio proteoclasticus]